MASLLREGAEPEFQLLADLALPPAGPPGPVVTRLFPAALGAGHLTLATPQPGLTVALLHLRLREALCCAACLTPPRPRILRAGSQAPAR